VTGVPSVRVVGLGLIGGSVARRASSRGWGVSWEDPAVDPAEVTAVDPSLRRGDPSGPDPDLVLLATPAGVAAGLLRSIDFAGGAVTSVCSVMAPLREIAERRGVRFLAGHPMAGKASRGLASSDPSLFEGMPWFIDSTGHEPVVLRLIADCGAEVVPVEAEEHDRAVAVTSHLPQILSSALAAVVERSDLPEPFIGTGLRTFLRLAGSRWDVWEPVVTMNADAIAEARIRLEDVLAEIESGKGEDVFADATALARRLERE
jgi:prephenate dehydrogenase